jgi:hypothetical protein
MRLHSLLLATATLILCPLAAHADTTYTYSGNPFDSVAGLYTTSDSIQGSFTVASPFLLNSSNVFTPSSFSFTDGLQTLTSLDSTGDFSVDVDNTGDFIGWNISVGSPNDSISTFDTNFPTFDAFDGAVLDLGVNSGENSHAPGTWTVANPVPEPSTLALLASGALGLLTPIRRRLSL